MKYFVQYDPETGRIKGRLNLSFDDGQSEKWENVIEVSAEEYRAAPELWKKIDLASKTLVNK